MKQLLTAGLLLGILLMISACNTIRGMGRDVASVGTGVERAASR